MLGAIFLRRTTGERMASFECNSAFISKVDFLNNGVCLCHKKTDDPQTRIILNCGHVFHEQCVRELKQCPVDNKELKIIATTASEAPQIMPRRNYVCHKTCNMLSGILIIATVSLAVMTQFGSFSSGGYSGTVESIENTLCNYDCLWQQEKINTQIAKLEKAKSKIQISYLLRKSERKKLLDQIQDLNALNFLPFTQCSKEALQAAASRISKNDVCKYEERRQEFLAQQQRLAKQAKKQLEPARRFKDKWKR